MSDNRGILALIAVLLVGLLAFLGWKYYEERKLMRPRIIVPVPRPVPVPVRPRRCPDCPYRSDQTDCLTGGIGAAVGGRTSPKGVPLSVDYPHHRHIENSRGNDGLGLCGYASNAMALDWAGHPEGRELVRFMEGRPGGTTPAKFDRDIKAFYASIGKPVPVYFHYEGADLSVLDRAVSSGRLVSGTYYRSPSGRYNGQRISHMVCWPHANGTEYAVLDNNRIGATNYEWMNRAEAEGTLKDRNGKMWLVVWKDAGPPPPPRNPKKGE